VTAAVDDLCANFIERANTVATRRRSCAVGPLPLRLRAADPGELDHIAEHVRASRTTHWPAIEIITVSAESVDPSIIPRELRPDGRETLVARGDRVTAVANGHEDSFWVLDAEHGRAIRWVRDADDLPYGELVSPLSLAVRWWATSNNLGALVHSGCVANADGAMLLVGNSGAGKSTSVMACLDTAGLTVHGDDQTLIEMTDQDAMAHPVYRLAKLVPNSIDLLPHLADRVVNMGRHGKALLDLPVGALDAVPVRGIMLVVQSAGQGTRIEPCSRVEVLKALGVSTFFQLSVGREATWEATTQLVRKSPCHLLLVDQPEEVPTVVAAALRDDAILTRR